MNDLKAKYIITLLVDGRDWVSRPIEAYLNEAVDEAKEQLRISRFYGKKPIKVEFKNAKLISKDF